jgi:hypothetical protein
MGAEINYLPNAPKDEQRVHKYGDKTLPGIFVGYSMHSGGRWPGDLLVLDWSELEDAETARDIYFKRVKAKEVNVVKLNGKLRFPLAEGALRQPGSREKLVRPRRSPATPLGSQDDSEDDVPPDLIESASEAGDNEDEESSDDDDDDLLSSPTPDFWTLNSDVLIRHHRTPRKSLYVPKPGDLPIPIDYLDVKRRTETDLDDFSESSISDFWSEAGSRMLSHKWTGKTVFEILRPSPPSGFKWISGRLTKVQETTRPDDVWPEMWRGMSKSKNSKQFNNQKSPSMLLSRPV